MTVPYIDVEEWISKGNQHLIGLKQQANGQELNPLELARELEVAFTKQIFSNPGVSSHVSPSLTDLKQVHHIFSNHILPHLQIYSAGD